MAQVSTDPALWLDAVPGEGGVIVSMRNHGDPKLLDDLKRVPSRLRPLIAPQLFLVAGVRWMWRNVRAFRSGRDGYLQRATIVSSDWPLRVGEAFRMAVRYERDELPGQVQIQCHEIAQLVDGSWAEHLVVEFPAAVDKTSKGELQLRVTLPEGVPPSFRLSKTAIRWTLRFGAIDPKRFPIWVGCSRA